VNITIAVALITALSTLSGGLIVSAVSLRIHRQQLAAQRQLAADEREEQQRLALRERQRQTYEQLLNRFDEIERALQKCWESHGIPGGDQNISPAMRAALNCIIGFEQMLNVVAIDGPEQVSDLALDLQAVAFTEFRQIISASSTAPDATSPLLKIARDVYVEAVRTRKEAKAKLIKAARAAAHESSETRHVGYVTDG
jgi:hypothetical protein